MDNTNYALPESDNNMTLGGWIGRIILSCVPVVGLVMLFVWAFGGNIQPSLKTWARAQLIFMLIFTVIALVFSIITGISLANAIK